MNIFGACLIVVIFSAVFYFLKLVGKSGEAVAISREALGVIRNSELSDEEKEEAMQKNSLRLFRIFFYILFGSALALGLPIGVIYVLDLAGVFSFQKVIDVTISYEFLGGTLVFGTILCLVLRKR